MKREQKLEKVIADKDEQLKKIDVNLNKAKKDLEALGEVLKDRDDELKSLKDPYALTELKSLLFDLDSQIEGVTAVKNE